jgi:16S rRNA (adenine1518-N6/adenine1519-N6)-dimethyltransferase
VPRRWGQHFLRDAATARRIVAAAGVRAGETILEIGPGTGRLTRALLEAAARVVAVEIDPRLAADLPARLGAPGRLEVIRADAAAADFDRLLAERLPPGGTVRCVASLPYESASAILARLLAAGGRVSGIAVLVQLEVAERITAPPGSRAYGMLSVLCQDQTEPRLALRLRPGAFRPPPKVDSALVVMAPRARPRRGDLDATRFRAGVAALFAQRRKTVGNNLRRAAGLDRDAAERLAREAGVSPEARPQDLSVEEFAALLRALGDLPARTAPGDGV